MSGLVLLLLLQLGDLSQFVFSHGGRGHVQRYPLAFLEGFVFLVNMVHRQGLVGPFQRFQAFLFSFLAFRCLPVAAAVLVLVDASLVHVEESLFSDDFGLVLLE